MFAVSITKDCPWRNGREEFSNVYQYGNSTTPTEAEADAVLDYLVAAERPMFAEQVRFLTGFVYEIGGTPAENEPIVRRDLSGTGSAGPSNGFYRECALLVSARSSRVSALGRPVYFRKWLHTSHLLGGTASAGVLMGDDPLPAETITALENYMESVISFTAAGQEWVMSSTNGGVAQSPATAFPYMEHRQFPHN